MRRVNDCLHSEVIMVVKRERRHHRRALAALIRIRIGSLRLSQDSSWRVKHFMLESNFLWKQSSAASTRSMKFAFFVLQWIFAAASKCKTQQISYLTISVLLTIAKCRSQPREHMFDVATIREEDPDNNCLGPSRDMSQTKKSTRRLRRPVIATQSWSLVILLR